MNIMNIGHSIFSSIYVLLFVFCFLMTPSCCINLLVGLFTIMIF